MAEPCGHGDNPPWSPSHGHGQGELVLELMRALQATEAVTEPCPVLLWAGLAWQWGWQVALSWDPHPSAPTHQDEGAGDDGGLSVAPLPWSRAAAGGCRHRQEQLPGAGQEDPHCSGQEHPRRAQPMAAGARGQLKWPTAPGPCRAGRFLREGCTRLWCCLKAWWRRRCRTRRHPLLQAPVVAALVPQDQRVPLPLSGWGMWGWEPPWGAPPSEMLTIKCFFYP